MSSEKNIMVGITTYNRKDILEKYAKSFNRIEGIENVHVCIFDDASSEYNKEYLCRIFSKIDYIHINDKNIGSDRNVRQMYEYFSKSDCKWLLNADSDLIFNSNILDKIDQLSPGTQGIFSVFNTPSHPVVSEYNDIFVEKEHVGSAGVVIRKDLVNKILNSIPEKEGGFDWDFSRYLQSINIKILVTKQSFCQHIGYYGQNSRIRFDYGENYYIDNLEDANIIEDLCEQIFCKDMLHVNADLNLCNIIDIFKYLLVKYVKKIMKV